MTGFLTLKMETFSLFLTLHNFSNNFLMQQIYKANYQHIQKIFFFKEGSNQTAKLLMPEKKTRNIGRETHWHTRVIFFRKIH